MYLCPESLPEGNYRTVLSHDRGPFVDHWCWCLLQPCGHLGSPQPLVVDSSIASVQRRTAVDCTQKVTSFFSMTNKIAYLSDFFRDSVTSVG